MHKMCFMAVRLLRKEKSDVDGLMLLNMKRVYEQWFRACCL